MPLTSRASGGKGGIFTTRRGRRPFSCLRLRPEPCFRHFPLVLPHIIFQSILAISTINSSVMDKSDASDSPPPHNQSSATITAFEAPKDDASGDDLDYPTILASGKGGRTSTRTRSISSTNTTMSANTQTSLSDSGSNCASSSTSIASSSTVSRFRLFLPRSDQEPLNHGDDYSEVISTLTPTDPKLSGLLSTSPTEALREIERRLFCTDNPTFCLPLAAIDPSNPSDTLLCSYASLPEDQRMARLYVNTTLHH